MYCLTVVAWPLWHGLINTSDSKHFLDWPIVFKCKMHLNPGYMRIVAVGSWTGQRKGVNKKQASDL